MNVRWERLAGDTSVFAIRIAFADDPSPGRMSEDVAPSWGALTIWANGANLTAHTVDGPPTSESVHWYLLPFLEWIAESWNPLLHEERLPCRVAGYDAAYSLAQTSFPPSGKDECAWEDEWQSWWKRHALQASRDGGLFPDIVLRRYRDQVEVSWRNSPPAGAPDKLLFLAAQGHARLGPASVAGPLYQVAVDAAAYLRERRSSARVEALVRKLAELKAAGLREERIAWMAKLGLSLVASKQRWNEVLSKVKTASTPLLRLFDAEQQDDLFIPGSCHGTLLFGSASPSVSPADVLTLAKAMARASSTSAAITLEIDRLASPQPIREGSMPWDDGYRIADEFRSHMGLEEDQIPDVPQLLQRLGVDLHTIKLSDSSTAAVSFAGDGLRPTVLRNPSGIERVFRANFTLAHELCHLLVDRDKAARLAIASGPWAPRDVEKRAGAFAAALLMPEAAVAKAVARAPGPPAELDSIVSIAKRLGASKLATIERLHDLRYVDDVEQEQLKDRLEGVD